MGESFAIPIVPSRRRLLPEDDCALQARHLTQGSRRSIQLQCGDRAANTVSGWCSDASSVARRSEPGMPAKPGMRIT
jgi:hypothetical protein